MGDYSLEMSEDVIEVQKWVHEFSENVIRPAAHEWDEKESTPWPIIQEAAKNGLYSLEFYAQQWFEPSGLGIPVVMEELFWGDAGIGLAIVGTTWPRSPCWPTAPTSRSASGSRRCSGTRTT